jgi:hypothetical protein
MATYSQSLTGTGSHNPFQPKSLKIPDSSLEGIAVPSATTGGIGASFNALSGIMQDGDLILCQGPDGALRYHKVDAERSTPGNIILLRV